MRYFRQKDGKVRAIDSDQEFLILDEWVELTEAEIDAVLNPPKSTEQLLAEYERAVESHVNATARAKGYNNIDSIAKYLVDGNPFKAEAEALSIWTASVWTTAHTMLNDWQNGGGEPTLEEVIAALPPAP